MGLITASGTTDITANHVKNHETGRIYGDDVTIDASSIENRKNTAREEQLEQEVKVLTEKKRPWKLPMPLTCGIHLR